MKLSQAKIADKVARLHELNKQIKALQDEANEIKDELKDTLSIGGFDVSVGSDKYSVAVIESANYSLDKERLIEDFGANTINKYTRVTPFIKIRITQVQ